jgi:predicted CXXCH cytochrome family protein
MAASGVRGLSIAGLLAGAPLCMALALWFGPDPTRLDPSGGLLAREGGYSGAQSCAPCHPEQHASWDATFHSSMTQLPTPQTVRGRFDGAPVTLFGATARPFSRDEQFFFELPAIADEPARTAQVALAVGSRRYQQYFELIGDEVGGAYRRLPLVWHIGDQRWMHMNGVFLAPDNNDWSRHQSLWNENCVFCHNTAPAPHLEVHETAQGRVAAPDKRFDTVLADLGIACEACHGPGAEHVRKQRSPLARYRAHLDGAAADIVDPADLDQHASVALCGQCHSQRLPSPREKIWTYLGSGPTFRPGGTLDGHVEPITRETPALDDSGRRAFAERFWADGTARLTAYEYLGVTQSPCFAGGELTCLSCHQMHGGDVHGQLDPRMRTDAACTQCHEQIARDVRAHTHHDPAGPGSRCLDCHMPHMVYGVVDIHRSHRIESPDTRRDVEGGRPHACTLCHADRDPLWAADRMREWWGERYERPRQRPDGAPLELSDALASLHAGDAVQRAVFAWRLGRPETALSASQRVSLALQLLVVLGDGYPSVRVLALRSLRALDRELALGLEQELASYDPLAAPDQRTARLLELLERVPPRLRPRLASDLASGLAPLLLSADGRPDLQRIRALLELQSDHVISIGE